MIYKNKSAGFTLIELLVVIAIIGILASVVLASLNSARAKGADAAVKGGMANMAAQIELWYDDSTKGNGTYGAASSGAAAQDCGGGVFGGDDVVKNAIDQIKKNSAAGTGGATYGAVLCNTDAQAQSWAMSTDLKSGTKWCIDNNGFRNAGTASGGKCLPASGGTSTGTASGGATTP